LRFRTLGSLASAHSEQRSPQFAGHRHRSDCQNSFHGRLLRMHRATTKFTTDSFESEPPCLRLLFPTIPRHPSVPTHILAPGLCLTLRPMRFPIFYDMFRDGIKNTWTVEEVDFQTDLADLKQRLSPLEVHVVQRLVASRPATASSPPISIPSISKKTDFCMKWMDSIQELDQLSKRQHRRRSC
jgi:hypothetical protein